MDQCQCSGPGYCPHLRREMNEQMVDSCRNNANTRNFLYDLSRGRIPPPPSGRCSSGQPHETVLSVVGLDRTGALRAGPCVHQGNPTGELRKCKSCSGNVKVKLMSCKVHGVCTVKKLIPGIACCQQCNEYQSQQLTQDGAVMPNLPV